MNDVKYSRLTDEELLRLYREGEQEIADYLLEKYKSLVRQKARKLFLIGGEPEDLIQEGMIGLYKAVRDYRDGRETGFRTFAGLCIDRQLYTAIQTSNRQKNLALNTSVSLDQKEEKELEGVSEALSPENILIDQENRERLEKIIEQKLSRLEKKVLELYLQGEGYQEISRILGKSPKSVDNAIQRIRHKITLYGYSSEKRD